MVDERRFIGLLEAAPQLPPTLLGIMALGDGLEPVRRAIQGHEPNLSILDVTPRPFLDHPNALWALALNFKSHIAETGLTTSREFPQVFLRTVASYVGQGEPLLCPPRRGLPAPSTTKAKSWRSRDRACRPARIPI